MRPKRYRTESLVRQVWTLAKPRERDQIRAFLQGNKHLGEGRYHLLHFNNESKILEGPTKFLTIALELDTEKPGLSYDEMYRVLFSPPRKNPQAVIQKSRRPIKSPIMKIGNSHYPTKGSARP